MAVNGEIYNHKALKALILEKHPNKKFNTQSDCEVRQYSSTALQQYASSHSSVSWPGGEAPCP